MKRYLNFIWFTILLVVLVFIIYNLWQPRKYPRKEVPSRELRALWLSRFEYCRYSVTHDQDSIRQYISEVMESAAAANFNTIFFQVRGNGDSYYRSELEPWGVLLTGEPGKDPGWDPLQFALEKAHSLGLELHAWINTFPVWRGKEPPPNTDPPSPFLLHPEWLVCDSSGNPMPLSDHYVSFSPGIPAVHDYLINLVLDIISRYEVDGVHFDYIRYPEGAIRNGYSHDSISVALFNSPEGNPLKLDFYDWQRNQLTVFVCKMYNAIKSFKPEIKVSAAVIGSYNKGRWNAYGAVFQDARRWLELGKMDFITPMTYWEIKHPAQPYLVRVKEWQEQHRFDRYVFPGIGLYRFKPGNGLDWNEAREEIKGLRKMGVPGMVFFSATDLREHWEEFKEDFFFRPALPPEMNFFNSPPPSLQASLSVSNESDSIRLSWELPDSVPRDQLKYFLIYTADFEPENPGFAPVLLKVLPAKRQFTTLPGADVRRFLILTAANAYYSESNAIPINIRQ